MQEQLLTRRELAKRLGVHYFTVVKWDQKGVTKPNSFIGNQPRYLLSEVMDQFAKTKQAKQTKGGAECKA